MLEYGPVDQYAEQADAFVKAVATGEPLETELEDTLQNTRVILALFESAKKGKWVELGG